MRRASILLRLCLSLAAFAPAWAAARNEPIERQTHGAVSLRGERQDIESLRVRQHLNEGASGKDVSDEQEAASDVEREWLIHLKGPIHRDLRVQLAHALGVEEDALKYVPSNTFLVSSTHTRVQAAKSAVPHVLWAGHVLPHHKVSPELHSNILDDFPEPRPAQTSLRRHVLTSEEDAVELAVVLAPHSHHRTDSTAAKWADRLGCEIALAGDMQGDASQAWVRIASPRKLIIRLHRRTVPEALQFLAQQHETSWVEPRERFRLRNKWAQGIIQSGKAFATPIFERGLTGTGQIIGIADTGIDMSLCFFHDDENGQPVNRFDARHRKVISYRHRGTWGNSIDEEGHGSHTTGSLVGKALGGLDQEFNGMAPDAKLIFDDIYANGDLSPPDDLEHDLFPVPYQHGARVRSESWGGDSIFYTTSAKETDAFSRRNRGFLVVWAAGNDGDQGMFTIGSPATAKNILCVGAQQSTRESMMMQEMGSTFLTLSSTSAGVEPLQTLGKWAGFGTKRAFSGTLVLGSPLDACRAIVGNGVRGKVALVQRGTCLFTVKAQNLQAAGAVGMVCYDNSYAPTVLMGGDAVGVTIPCLSISRHDGEDIRNMLAASGGSLHITSQDDGPDLWQQNLADFSGKGPTGDGRLMPDIVAPGADVWSAKAGGHCGTSPPLASVASMGGTSMAAPVAAGGVALIAQYFKEGWYPAGEKGKGSSHEASGALLRAMVMNGGRRLTGALDVSGDGGNQWLDLDPKLPNNQQGYGAMDLETVLYFKPQAGRSPPALFVRDDEGPFATQCLNTGDATAFGFRVSSGKRFKATIAWTDPEASLVADVVLVNDLDLTLLGPGNREWVGNNITSIDKDGGAYSTRDRTNNKEQIELKYPVAGEYTVIVRGHHVPEGPQCYSLVVTGDFQVMADAKVECSESCSVHGSCVKGECVCQELWSGVDCLRPIPQISSGTITATVYPDSWQYYAIDLGASFGGGFHVKMQKKSVDGDPDLFVMQDGLPTILNFSVNCECADGGSPPCECRQISCDSCDDLQVWPVRELKSYGEVKGRFIIGVTGFCCDPVEYTLNVRLEVMGCDGVKNSGVVADCQDVCGGSMVVDVCGRCGGQGDSCRGCDGIANSGKVLDECKVCGGDDTTCVGCDGRKNSGKVLDVCGDCDGSGTSCLGCDGVPYSGKKIDVCNICDGGGTSCLGCDGRPNSGKVLDACGKCGGDGRSCAGCDGIAASGLVHDACGVCGGNGTSCAGCDGVSNSGAVVDGCGVCNGFNTSCMGCDGVLYGLEDDACRVCGGDNSTCLICETGKSGVDSCGVCGGDNSSCAWLSSWTAPVRVIAAIQLSGISVEVLMVDSVSTALAKTIAEYLQSSEDRVHFGAIIEKSSDTRRREQRAARASQQRAAGASQAASAQSSSSAHPRPRSSTRTRDGAAETYVVVSFHADLRGATAARMGAMRLVEAVSNGEAGLHLSQEIKMHVEASLAKPPVFEPLVYEGGDEQKYSDTVTAEERLPLSGSKIALLVLIYMLLAGGAAWWGHNVPEKARRPPCVVFCLWLVFGILGVHRFYTRTPRVGMLYFCTLGLCGVGWLLDLYWQRRYLFGINAKGGNVQRSAPIVDDVSRSGKQVIQRGKDLIVNSTFGEQWRRKKEQRRNRHQRLEDDVEQGAGGEVRGGRSHFGRGRGGRLGKGGARAEAGETCGEVDDVDYDASFGELPAGANEVALKEVRLTQDPLPQACNEGTGARGRQELGIVEGIVEGGFGVHNNAVHTVDELDELAIHEPGYARAQ